MDNEGVMQTYQVITGLQGNYPFVIHVNSIHNLVSDYKDAVLGEKQFLTWESGCMEMKNVLGVFG
jgi:hypothetical protein